MPTDVLALSVGGPLLCPGAGVAFDCERQEPCSWMKVDEQAVLTEVPVGCIATTRCYGRVFGAAS